jgi:heme exporter protein C
MLIMTLGFWMYSFAVVLTRMRCVILERGRQSTWIQESAGPAVVEAR